MFKVLLSKFQSRSRRKMIDEKILGLLSARNIQACYPLFPRYPFLELGNGSSMTILCQMLQTFMPDEEEDSSWRGGRRRSSQGAEFLALLATSDVIKQNLVDPPCCFPQASKGNHENTVLSLPGNRCHKSCRPNAGM